MIYGKVTYDKAIFEGLDPNKGKAVVKKMMQELCSGTTNNPLYQHWTDGQSKWSDDAPEYAAQKRAKGSNNKFEWTGNAKNAIKAKSHKNKKITASYRKAGYYLTTATLSKMVDGRNVYKLAQVGRLKSMSGTIDGKQVSVSAKDWIKDQADAGKKYKGSEAEKAGIKKARFKQALLQNKYNFDKGSAKRGGTNERLITANLPGDDKLIDINAIAKSAEKIITDSGYKLN